MGAGFCLHLQWPICFVHIEIVVLPGASVCISADLRSRRDCELIIVCLYIPPNKIWEFIVPLNCFLDFISKRFPGSSPLIIRDFNYPDVDCLHLIAKSCWNQSFTKVFTFLYKMPVTWSQFNRSPFNNGQMSGVWHSMLKNFRRFCLRRDYWLIVQQWFITFTESLWLWWILLNASEFLCQAILNEVCT